MNTTYKPRIASPYQVAKKHPFDISSSNHPVRKALLQNIGRFELAVTFKEDVQTINTLKIPGLIAFMCTIEHKGKVIGIGRSNAVISETSKYFDRIIQGAWGYSLVDSISKMTRSIDSLHVDQSAQSQDTETVLADAYKTRDSYGIEMITEKQRKFLLELIHTNIRNEDERTLRESQIEDMTRAEASRAIQSFQK